MCLYCHRKVFICGQGAFLFFRTIFCSSLFVAKPSPFLRARGGQTQTECNINLGGSDFATTLYSGQFCMGNRRKCEEWFFWARGREGGRSDD